MSWHEHAKITDAQRREIAELLKKLGWPVERYEAGLMWKLDESLWFQAVAMIGGLEYLLAHPSQWTKL